MADSCGLLIYELFVPVLNLVDQLAPASNEEGAIQLYGCDAGKYWLQVGRVLRDLDQDNLPGRDLTEVVRIIADIYQGTRSQCDTFPDVAIYLFQRLDPLKKAAKRGWTAAKQGGTIPDDPFPKTTLKSSAFVDEPAGSEGGEHSLTFLDRYPAATFSKLLDDFRREWCKHADAWLVIEIKAPGFSSTENPPFDRTTHELLAPVRVPMNHEKTVFTLGGYATFIIGRNNKAARDSFKQLCKEAGAALPSQFREALSEYCPWDVANPASWWIALLLYRSGAVARWESGMYRDSIALSPPFCASIEAIEECKLATDIPVLPDATDTKTDQIEPEEDPPKDPAIDSNDGLQNVQRKAWFSFLYAEAKNGKRLEDQAAFDWLEENGIEPTEEESDLVGYELPAFDTWIRYLRHARKALGEQKYTPLHALRKDRRGTQSVSQQGTQKVSGSIVRIDEIDRQ